MVLLIYSQELFVKDYTLILSDFNIVGCWKIVLHLELLKHRVQVQIVHLINNRIY